MSNPTPAAVAASDTKSVDLARVDLTVLNAVLKEAGIKVTSKTKVEERVRLLEAYELEQCPKDNELPEAERKLGDCTVCNGVSQLSRPACPYCGTAEDQPAPTAPALNPPPKSAKASKAKAATKPAEETAPKTAALAKAPAGKITKKNVEEIVGIERRIKGLIADSIEGHWKVGRELAQVLKNGQWKYRVGDDGKPSHKAFGDWVSETFGITVQYARQLIAVSDSFTAAQVREVGVKKLTFALRLPEENRDEMAARAADMPATAVEAEVQRLAPGATRAPTVNGSSSTARPGVSAANARRAAEGAARPSRTPKANEVTAVLALQRYELPMFARAMSAEADAPVRAKTVSAGPHAVLDLQNGVQLVVKIVEDETGLISVLEFKRVADEQAAAE